MNTNSDASGNRDLSHGPTADLSAGTGSLPAGSAEGGAEEQHQVTLRGPAQLADSLPYLLGFHPSDSVVLVALHGPRGRFGGRLRVGIPKSPQEWAPVASHLAECLMSNSERRGGRPDGVVVFLCQDPGEGQTGRQVMERLRAFAQRLRLACGALDVPVLEALCVSDGRFWSYCCPDRRCCPSEGTVLALPGTSVMAAAAAYAGIQVRGTLREMKARFASRTRAPERIRETVGALDDAGSAVMSRMLTEASSRQVGQETLVLARTLLRRLGRTAPPRGSWEDADSADDALITDAEAGAVLHGLQDRETRDLLAEWMEGPEAAHALRLWRLLARRCVGPYATYAAPPLTLAGWVAWSTGDEPEARVALGLALEVDRHYTFAQLLHQACNDGFDPEKLRACLRRERVGRSGGPVPGPPRGAPAGTGGNVLSSTGGNVLSSTGGNVLSSTRRKMPRASATRIPRASATRRTSVARRASSPSGRLPSGRGGARTADRQVAGPPARPGAGRRGAPPRMRRGARSGR
ncbi:hypothetical protein GCM10010329_28460 [Streptomyces spiroverticillatus]|uniref:DUF4192 family protein n=1 Tax=Streptomyces finlayi TaxID=67296 RepID=A0A918WWD7_9ACTN|nr:DUF4192 domain-containing protein [Streptomyces finlayi]GHA04207.1 hypothetical protein GCM10010329_28460 [Streptomyces spiroverticillatus]GHC88289.1 hypothetical protein GCM10010334_20870 [Streptomyces finlayi]